MITSELYKRVGPEVYARYLESRSNIKSTMRSLVNKRGADLSRKSVFAKATLYYVEDKIIMKRYATLYYQELSQYLLQSRIIKSGKGDAQVFTSLGIVPKGTSSTPDPYSQLLPLIKTEFWKYITSIKNKETISVLKMLCVLEGKIPGLSAIRNRCYVYLSGRIKYLVKTKAFEEFPFPARLRRAPDFVRTDKPIITTDAIKYVATSTVRPKQ